MLSWMAARSLDLTINQDVSMPLVLTMTLAIKWTRFSTTWASQQVTRSPDA
ncbi:hypothetical protein E2C01_066252 [Portunus trituberculatus]|uniref:Uncharacterized protein n=1 Tax=Portunus trituberculatus TaxID=210409 RepID=A0A5B7HHQ7_PORTR|nr:hypothetical protein [Portunus trituberculatus]